MYIYRDETKSISYFAQILLIEFPFYIIYEMIFIFLGDRNSCKYFYREIEAILAFTPRTQWSNLIIEPFEKPDTQIKKATISLLFVGKLVHKTIIDFIFRLNQKNSICFFFRHRVYQRILTENPSFQDAHIFQGQNKIINHMKW